LDILAKLSQFYDVSTDYLLGLECDGHVAHVSNSAS
jgi:hypothetical protein